MGSIGSKSASSNSHNIGVEVEGNEQVYFNIRNPVELHQSLIDRLTEPSPETSAPRQAALDEAVQRKLKADLQNLKGLEAELESKVSQAFRQQTTSSDKENADGTPSSKQLMQELSIIRQKADQFKTRNTSGMWPEISTARTAIASCLSQHKQQPLKCGEELENFKQLVFKHEKEFLSSLQ